MATEGQLDKLALRKSLRLSGMNPSQVRDHMKRHREGVADATIEVAKFLVPVDIDSAKEAYEKDGVSGAVTSLGKDAAFMAAMTLATGGTGYVLKKGAKAYKRLKARRKAAEVLVKNTKTGPSILDKRKGMRDRGKVIEALEKEIKLVRKNLRSQMDASNRVAKKARTQSGRRSKNTIKAAAGMRRKARVYEQNVLKPLREKLMGMR